MQVTAARLGGVSTRRAQATRGVRHYASLLRSAWLILCGSAAVGLITWAGYHWQLSFAAASFCCLMVLVPLSLAGDFVSSAFVSFVAVGCLDYFLVNPVLSLRIANPLNALALLSFLLTALVITRLVTKVRDKAESSEVQHQKTKELYELAQHLLALDPESATGSKLLEPFRGVFGISAVCLYDASAGELHLAGSRDRLPVETREAYIRGLDKDDMERRVSLRCIRFGGRVTGAVGFEGLEDPALTAGPLTALAVTLLDRRNAFQKANQASAAAQTEAYRSVILDALAHEFKTPLSTILAAAGALREAGSLGPEHMEMAETVESEAARLGRLTTRLIRTARLEREEVKPWMELIDVAALVAELVEQYTRSSPDRSISVVDRCVSTEVLADPELLRLAISQLLDNACKYSPPDSRVEAAISQAGGYLTLRVSSSGGPIPVEERHRIFDRFYRGAAARRTTSGTGLGLYVARKIALAHGGNLELDTDGPEEKGTAFRLTLPAPNADHEIERNDVAAAS